MNIQTVLNDKSFQVAFTASLVFLVAAFPPLFKFMDNLFSPVLGKNISNYYIILLLHAVIVGILMYLFTSYILKPVYKMLNDTDNSNVLKVQEVPKKKKSLEKFSVGGQMTCGGKK